MAECLAHNSAAVTARDLQLSAQRMSRRRYLQTAAAGVGAAAAGLLRAGRAGAQEGMGEQAPPPVQLTGALRTWISAYFPITGNQAWKEIYDGFQAKHPDLKIEIGEGAVRGDAEVIQKIGTSIAAGDPEDVLHMGGFFGGDYASQGWIRSLDPYFATSNVLVKTDLWPSWLTDSLYKGENYALNFAGDVRILYLHKDAWQRVGLDPKRPLRTWGELEEAARRLTRRNQAGDLEAVGYNPAIMQWLWPFFQLGGEMVDPSGERIVIDRGDAGIKTLEFYQRLFDVQGGQEAFTKFHLANGATEQQASAPTGAGYNAYNALFQQGKVAIFVGTYSHRSEQFRPQGFSDDNWDFMTFPLPPIGRQANWGGSHALGIPALAKNPEAGWAFIEHFSLEENDLRFCVAFDRVPIRPATAASDEYIRGDPFLAHQSEQAWYRRFFPGIPGVLNILPFWNRPMIEVLTGQRGPRDAILQVARDMQAALDRAQGRI